MTFRELGMEEVLSFRKWARLNDTPAHREKASIYHPEVRAEWARMDSEEALTEED